MKHSTYISKPLRISVLKLIGGGKSLKTSALHHSLSFLSIPVIVSFLCLACSKETSRSSYPEMQAFYAESCHLGVAVADSINRFSQKVDAFVTQHTDAKDDPLYPRIQENIRSVSFRLNIYINGDWDGETHVNF